MNAEISNGLVSTIIPVFNRPAMLEEAVRSVLAQDYQPIEIILVDDGSTDGTAAKIAQLAAQHPQIVALTQSNAGPGVARELGRLQARGEYLQYLDSDDLLHPDKFSRQVSALCAQPDCGAAYGWTEYQFADQAPQGTAIKRTGERITTMFPSFLNDRWWSTSTPLWRRSLTDQIGAWRTICNEEDWEYDCRAAALGTKLAYVDQLVSITRRHDQHLSSEGVSDPIKLRHRAEARVSMYHSAQRSTIEIPITDMQYFAKSAFLLARQCAAAGVDDCAQEFWHWQSPPIKGQISNIVCLAVSDEFSAGKRRQNLLLCCKNKCR